MPNFKDVVKSATKITSFIHGISSLRAEWLKVNETEFVRCGVTRFATSFLTLQSIKKAKDNLRKFDWSRWANNTNGLEVADLMINTRFWMRIDDLLKASEPILKVLRIVDGDSKPSMPFLHGAFLEAKKAIRRNFEDNEASYGPIIAILDKRWAKHYKSPLVKAAFFLNPGFYYKMER